MPDLRLFCRAPLVEDLRLGGTTTTTPLSTLVAMFPNTHSAILDVGHSVAPGWWSAKQVGRWREVCWVCCKCIRIWLGRA